MTRVYLADAQDEERSALHLLLNDLKMEVVGEATDWLTTLSQIPVDCPDMLLVDWDLLPADPHHALMELRTFCPSSIVIVLIFGQQDARQQAALSAGADAFISKVETGEKIADRIKAAANIMRVG
jgi:DNA-binding NarL/FixJ family response regulator